YDHLGGGRSERPPDTSLWTIDRFVEELVTVRRSLGLERVHLLGQSWGSMLAVDFLLTRPSGVASLICSGPCLSASRFAADQQVYLRQFPAETQKIIREAEAAGDFHSPPYQEAMLAFYRRHLCRLAPWPECLTRTFEQMGLPVYEQMWGPSEFTITGTLKDYERAEQLKEIRLPVLFTCGRFDEATPETTAYYRSYAPGAELAIFEDASHTHHLEKTAEYLGVVGDFLQRAEKY
ncbi:MAG: proline iminopeptidase-family hydrolase, partial [Desulfobaccales bacterium]